MGQIREVETTIDGVQYRMRTLSAVDALRIFPRLMSILPPGIAEVVLTTDDEDWEKVTTDEPTMLSIIQSISRAAASVPDGLGVVWSLLAGVEYLNAPPESEPVWVGLDAAKATHFAADYYRLFRLAAWAGRVTFRKP